MRLPSPFICILSILSLGPVGESVKAASSDQSQIMEHASDPWNGDLEGMSKRGFLRILTVHNPLLFSFDGVRQKGIVAELARLYQQHLNEEIGSVRAPTVIVIPVARDELIPGLIEGRGDLIMGNLKITPNRLMQVDFSPPLYPDIDELVWGPLAFGAEADSK